MQMQGFNKIRYFIDDLFPKCTAKVINIRMSSEIIANMPFEHWMHNLNVTF